MLTLQVKYKQRSRNKENRQTTMIKKDEIQALLYSTETYRIEKTTFTGNMGKLCEAICTMRGL